MPLTILVADDDAPTLEMLAMFLETGGRTVLTASTGSEAWHLALKHVPDVIVLDARMPGLSGAEVAQRVRDEPALRGCSLIALSGLDERDGEGSHLFDRYFTKPVSPADLLAAMQELEAGRRAS